MTVQEFKYASLVMLIPLLALAFFLPGLIAFGIFLLFYILKALVLLRSAIINEIDAEKRKKYAGNESAANKGLGIICSIIAIYVIGILIIYNYINGLAALILSVMFILLVLPHLIEEIIVIKRCLKERE